MEATPQRDDTFADQRAAVAQFELTKSLSVQSREIAAGRRDISVLLLGIATAERHAAISAGQKGLLKDLIIRELQGSLPYVNLLQCLGEAYLARCVGDPPLRLAGVRPQPFAPASNEGVEWQLREVTLMS